MKMLIGLMLLSSLPVYATSIDNVIKVGSVIKVVKDFPVRFETDTDPARPRIVSDIQCFTEDGPVYTDSVTSGANPCQSKDGKIVCRLDINSSLFGTMPDPSSLFKAGAKLKVTRTEVRSNSGRDHYSWWDNVRTYINASYTFNTSFVTKSGALALLCEKTGDKTPISDSEFDQVLGEYFSIK